MTGSLLDANHLSPLVTVGHPLRARIYHQFHAGDIFAITAPVLSEFLFGMGGLPRSQQNWQEWEILRADFAFYEIDAQDAEKAAKLRLELRQQGWQIGLVDAFSAVIALN